MAAIVLVLFIGMGVLSGWQYQQLLAYEKVYNQAKDRYTTAESTVKTQVTEISTLKRRITGLQESVDTAQDKADLYTAKADYLDTYMAIMVNPNGNCAYHKLDCYIVQGDYKYLDDVFDAKDNGCWPCSKCH